MQNLYYEYRSWQFFWALFFDRKNKIQKILDEYNKKGWRVVHVQYGIMGHLPLGKLIFIYLITFATLGFMTYWIGFSIIFEKVPAVNSSINTTDIIASENKIKVKQTETTIDNDIQNAIAPLKDLIDKEKRKGMFSKSVSSEIIEHLAEYCDTKEKGIMFINGYESKYNSNLIEDLKKLSSSYNEIKALVSVFIDLEIVEEKFPHKMIEA